MRCKFCQAEYETNYNRCPICGMREEYDDALATSPDATETREKISRNPFYWIWHSLTRYCSGKGRARRTEYFYFMFFAFAIWIGVPYALLILSESSDELLELASKSISPVSVFLIDDWSSDALLLFVGATALGAALFAPPIISLIVRRLHDLGLSGWYVVTICALQWTLRGVGLDIFTSIVPLCLWFWPGTKSENAYGPNPRYVVREKDAKTQEEDKDEGKIREDMR